MEQLARDADRPDGMEAASANLRDAAPRAHPSPYVQPWDVEDGDGCFFYHTLELPGRGLVDGSWDLRGRFADYIGHADLGGARVLDVGCAGGFLSFSAEAAGAEEVVSFDLDTAARQDLLPFAGSRFVVDHAGWVAAMDEAFDAWKRGYWLAHRLLRSRARVAYGDVYHLPVGIGRFDAVIVGAILEHLIDPLSALRAVAGLSDDLLIINTDYLDAPAPLALFLGTTERPQHSYTFWQWSIALYDAYMAILGFAKIGEEKHEFAGTRPSPEAARPMMPRVALVYGRRG